MNKTIKKLLKTDWEIIAGITAAVAVIVLKFLHLVHEETMLTLAVVLLAGLFLRELRKVEIDTIAGEQLIAQVVDQLGDDAKYFETQGLANKEDYSKACKSFIRFYELILANDEKIAGNGLRYAFSP